MILPTIVICVASARADLNRVWDAMGEGPSTFTTGLCADDPASTSETPPTHYIMLNMAASDSDAAIWQAMAQNNDLPPISGTWGQNGVISSEDAQAAIAAGNMLVFSAAGLATEQQREEWLAGVLASQDLQFIPNPGFG